MKTTITGRTPLRAWARDRVYQYRAVDHEAQRRAAEHVFPFERDGYHVEDGVHDSLIATDLSAIERRLYDHYRPLTTTVHDDTTRWERITKRLQQFFCGLRGHDSVLHFEGKRVNMRCTSCGHDTPGWDVSGRGPRQRFEGDARRHALVSQRLMVRKTP